MKKYRLADKIRINIIDISVTLIVPILALTAYLHFASKDFVSSELGGYVTMGIVLISAIVAHITYRYLFPKYADDLGDIKFYVEKKRD